MGDGRRTAVLTNVFGSVIIPGQSSKLFGLLRGVKHTFSNLKCDDRYY